MEVHGDYRPNMTGTSNPSNPSTVGDRVLVTGLEVPLYVGQT